MGLLSSTLRHLDCCGQGLTVFPPALMQLVALECLVAERNEFMELPAAITALSRLTELILGRIMAKEDPLQVHGKRPLDVRALGDLSGVPGATHVELCLLRSNAVLLNSGCTAPCKPLEASLLPCAPRATMRAGGATVEPGAQATGARLPV